MNDFHLLSNDLLGTAAIPMDEIQDEENKVLFTLMKVLNINRKMHAKIMLPFLQHKTNVEWKMLLQAINVEF